MSFEITKTFHKSIPILGLEGCLMDTNVFRFSRELKQLVKDGHIRIALDVSRADFFDSHALGILVFHYTNMSKENRNLIIINNNSDPQAYMNGLFESTGLINVFPVITNKEALSSC
ncbi:MAG: STAS domain-containing protein [Chitinivibrionales bacterium]|nr:STAS domain-containing protein [Chitinivibrionales bacterium]